MPFIPQAAFRSLCVAVLYGVSSTLLSTVCPRVLAKSSRLDAPTALVLAFVVPILGVCAPPALSPYPARLGVQLNKAVLSGYAFSGFFVMMAASLLITLLFCEVSKVSFGNPFGIPSVDKALVKQWVARRRGVLTFGTAIAECGPRAHACGS